MVRERALTQHPTEDQADYRFRMGVFWIRKVNRITYEDLSANSPYSTSYIHHIEHGSRPITPQVREALTQTLGFSSIAIELAGVLIPGVIDAVTARTQEDRLTKLQALHEFVEQLKPEAKTEDCDLQS